VHERRFGHAATAEPLELVNVRLTVIGKRKKIEFPEATGSGAAAQIGTRPIYLEDPQAPQECAVYRRELLSPGVQIPGPCVIEEYGSTTVLFAGDSLSVAPTGELIIQVANR